MRLAVAAGGGAPENVAYVQALLGDLELQRGRVDAAELAYRLALGEAPRLRGRPLRPRSRTGPPAASARTRW